MHRHNLHKQTRKIHIGHSFLFSWEIYCDYLYAFHVVSKHLMHCSFHVSAAIVRRANLSRNVVYIFCFRSFVSVFLRKIIFAGFVSGCLFCRMKFISFVRRHLTHIQLKKMRPLIRASEETRNWNRKWKNRRRSMKGEPNFFAFSRLLFSALFWTERAGEREREEEWKSFACTTH